MKDFFETHRPILWAVVFTFAVLITAPGIGNQSGQTLKDEYHRVFRTALTLVLFSSLSLLWYAHVYLQFTDYTLKVMEVEFEARRFGRFQLDPLLQFAALFFPWTVMLVATLLNVRRGLGVLAFEKCIAI